MSDAAAKKRGRKPIVETEEFQQAVAAFAAKAVEDRMAELSQRLVAGTGETAPNGNAVDLLEKVLSKLSTNMEALSNQGQRKRPLTPEEVERRSIAEKRMVSLILASREQDAEKPSYKLTSKVYLNERLIEPYKTVDKRSVHNEITWTGEPDDGMSPLNDPARAIFAAWRESTGGPTELVPTADRRKYSVTPGGLTIKGEIQSRRFVSADPAFNDDLEFNNGDPNAPEIAVLGTVAARARRNGVGAPAK